LRVTLCDSCGTNLYPYKNPNYFGHMNKIEIPEKFRTFIEGSYQYDFCSPECRTKWFDVNKKIDKII